MSNPPTQDTEFKRFAAKRIIIGIILIVAVLWTIGGIMGIIERPEPIPHAALGSSSQEAATADSDDHGQTAAKAAADDAHGEPTQSSHGEVQKSGHGKADAESDAHAATDDSHGDDKAAAGHGASSQDEGQAAHAEKDTRAEASTSHGDTSDSHGKAAAHGETSAEAPRDSGHGEKTAAAGHGEVAEEETVGHKSAVNEAISPKLPVHKQKGVATVEAVIGPMENELEERFWGWRPNDLIDVTDNVNNYQLGILEVTRRSVVALNERISRTGVTDAFDPDLENATNWFMIKATKYWFPSAESKYSEGIADLKKYRDSLQAKRATFYTRSDNLIPLLASFEDLLGSCDENLVKHVEEDGSEVSWFKTDNYFFYAQGVAAAMAPILEAIHHDFLITLETRHGIELLHHAVESCKTAAALDPWIITDSQLDGILANHRANLAAPISHARFYLGVLIKALST